MNMNETSATIDMRTEREKKRDDLHKGVCDAFVYLSERFPEASRYRKLVIIGNQFSITAQGVRGILKSKGLI